MRLLSEKCWLKRIRYLRVLVIVFSLLLGGAGSLPGSDWKQAVGPWKWSFPRDHGSHPDFRTEWWYFTGNLSDTSARRFGYQLTFFRQGVVFKVKDPSTPWSVRDLFPGHFALTDVSARRFAYAERLSRGGPGLAGAARNQMDVWLLNWSARMKENTIRIEAKDQAMEIFLELTPRKPIVFQGQNGLSKKGPKEGQASYYFSYTDLATKGWIKTPTLPSPLLVKGRSWLDHEFGSNQLASNQVGWDWFSLCLSNGQDLMIYFLRRSDGSVEPTSSGALVSSDGRTTNLSLSEMSVEVLDHWKSSKTGGKYPSRWKIKIPVAGIELAVNPLLADQELVTEGSTGVVYWEGAVDGRGRSRGQEVTCEGYVEMTGYAGSLAGFF
ncbi:MAG: putative exported protein [Deltaproteobacteria bacterium]|nr:putative exported protein [Deltaproteobacteria bacterium]